MIFTMASSYLQGGTTSGLNTTEDHCTLLQLPEHIIQHALSFLAYSEISEARRVCQYFNRCCQELLTRGFNKADRFHNQIQREVKSKLPRRESERRNHELSRHVDILSAVETRLSLLSMTYSKYIDHGLCCFIPGKVLDELFSLLKKLQVRNSQPPRAHEFLQELRDISSMAMEHFEEHIIPGLKQHLPSGSLPLVLSDPFSPEQGSPSPVIQFSTSSMRMPSLRQELMRLQQQVRVQSSSLQSYKKELAEHKNKMVEQRKMSIEHEKKLQEQSRKIQEQNRIISDQSSQIDMLQTSINNFNNKLTGIYTLIKGNNSEIPTEKKITDSAISESGGFNPKCNKKLKKARQEESEMMIVNSWKKRKTESDTCEVGFGKGKGRPLKRK